MQGGPGTGKTAVGLHRASFLLYTHREPSSRRILVVGPNPTFMDYVSHVLPILGEENVDQRAVGGARRRRDGDAPDAPGVARLKADPRVAEVVRERWSSASRRRAEELDARLDGAFVRDPRGRGRAAARGGARFPRARPLRPASASA